MKLFGNIVQILLAAIVVLSLVKIPEYVSAQTTLRPIGTIDAPTNNSILKGQMELRGWFLDGNGVAKIDVLVDGAVTGQASYGDSRPDVLKAYPGYNNGNAGFHWALDTSKFSDGLHTVTIRETEANGRVTTLPAYTITIANVKGYMDNPISGTTLIGTKNVSGWLLDEGGIASIDVLVDGTVAGQASYGDPRPDVHKAFPQYTNGGNSGFHFALDTSKFSDGPHTVAVKETGANGRVTTLTSSTITIANVKGYVDTPISTTLIGIQNVSGWLLDEGGIASIDVLVDGTVAGQASYGDSRPDVHKAFPQYTNGENSGFHFALDSTKFSDGPHTVSIRETGVNGRVTTLTSSTTTIANVKGYMDTPISGTTLTGTKNVSGWLLDEGSIASIDVLVDGTVAGQASYGDPRPDVHKAFPQYTNGENAGFHFALDSTKFSDGPHTISIRETSINGIVTPLTASTITIANVKGYLDTPISSTLRGTKNFTGWFLDESGVASIDVLVDGNVAGQASYGDPRPDVHKAFPQYTNGENAGFHLTLDTTKFSDGPHTVIIRETGANGRTTTLAEKTVTFNQSSYIVFLDPGHGGSDPGATGGGVREADLNLAVAKKVQAILLNRGYIIYMSRNDDTFIPLLDRSQMANDVHADIFVSMHHNSTTSTSTTVSGIESYYYQFDPAYPSKINASMDRNPDRIAKSITLAGLIQQKLIAYTSANNNGTAGETFSVVRESAMPATLLELGYINNPAERQKLITDSYQNTLASAISDAIDQYFQIY